MPGTAHGEKAIQIPSRLPINLRHGNASRSPHYDEKSVDSDDGEIIDDTNKSGGLDLGLEKSSDDQPESINSPLNKPTESFEIEDDNELLPLTLADEGRTNPASRLWKACRRPKSANTNIAPSTKPEQNDISYMKREVLGPKEQFKGFLKMFSTLARETNEYAPSGPIVASAALDLCMPVFLNFHMFMIFTHADNSDDSQIPPQVLIIIFLSILILRSFVPFGRRKRFWGTVHSAVAAPFYGVTFRDEVIGEVATSMVRPLQDILFALFYYVVSWYGIFSGTSELESTGTNLETNTMLHNVVLPTCAVLPLLCRFMQTLRQAYAEQRRWPHLGNALKYFTASMVLFYGITHSEEERSALWKYCFVLCLLYQIWWDIMIDWQLVRTIPKEDVDPSQSCCIPFLGRIEFRSRRLFKNDRTYWRIITFNTLFRFTWMLSFIPAYHIDWEGEIKHTLSVDLKTIVSFAISLTELMRRCCWVILRLEMETIKINDEKYVGNHSSAVSSRVKYRVFAPKDYSAELPTMPRSSMKWAAYRLLVKRLFCLELFLYFAAFIFCGLWVAALV